MSDHVQRFAGQLQAAMQAFSRDDPTGPVIDAVGVVSGHSLTDVVLSVQFHHPRTGERHSDTLVDLDVLLADLEGPDEVESLAALLWSGYHESLFAID